MEAQRARTYRYHRWSLLAWPALRWESCFGLVWREDTSHKDGSILQDASDRGNAESHEPTQIDMVSFVPPRNARGLRLHHLPNVKLAFAGKPSRLSN